MSYGKAKSAFNGPEPWCSRANSPPRPEVPPTPYKWDANDPSQLPSNVAKLRALQHLSLSSIKAASYDETSSGPLRPGFPFHRTLANPPMLLELNMPATIYVKGRKVFMLCTDPKTGILKKIVPDFQEIEDKLAFIKNFVNLCVQSSRPPVSRRNVVASPEEDGAPRYDLGDSIATRIVAVVKKIDNTGEHDHVVMQTLLLNTLGLQGYLQLALDGDELTEDLIIQQYIRPRGKTANFYRVFWQRIPGTSSTVVGYNLANTKANAPVDKQQVILTNAVIINAKYRDVHNSEAADEDKQKQRELEATTTAQDITRDEAPVRGTMDESIVNHNHINEEPMRDSNLHRAEGVSVDVCDHLSDGHSKKPSETHGTTEDTDGTAINASNDGGDGNADEDSMYLQLHATAESIDQKLLRLLRDDVWTYTNDTPRPSGLFLENSERDAAIKVSRDLDKFQSHSAMCSLCTHHDDKDLVSRVQFDRVTSNAMPNVQNTIDKLAVWIGHTVSKKHDLSIMPQELVCDFIRDDRGVFYFLQLKGFKLDEPSTERCVAWAKVMNTYGGYIDESDEEVEEDDYDDDDNDHMRVDPKEKWKMRFGHKRLTVSELTNKLREETGDECKLCGCSYVAAQVTKIGKDGVLGVNDHRNDIDVRTSTVSFKQQQLEKGREIPVFGYNMSVKQACQVLELYRDYSYPLTKYARAVLMGYAKTIDVTVAKAAYINEENNNDNNESTTYEDDLPKTRPVGAISTCYVCAKMLKETKNKATAAEKLSSCLGIPTKSKIVTKKGEDKVFNYHLAHIPRTAVQWRMLVMAHYISDVKLPRSHELYGAQGCISYTLGRRKSNLMFKVVPDSTLSDRHSVCLVRQCRIHYMCGSVDDVRELFESKDIQMKLTFTKKRKRSQKNEDDGIGGRYLRHLQMLRERQNKDDNSNDVEQSGFHEVALRSIRLDKLKFRDFNALEDHTYDGYFNINDSEKGVWGSDKVDLMLPVKPLGPNALLRISVAVVSDDEFHQRLVDTKFFKEGAGVFWPEPWYHDDQALPTSWINMLSTTANDISSANTTAYGQSSSSSLPDASPSASTEQAGLSHLRSKDVMMLRESISNRLLKKGHEEKYKQLFYSVEADSKKENEELNAAMEAGKLVDCVAGELERKSIVENFHAKFKEAVKYEGLSEHHNFTAINEDLLLEEFEARYDNLQTMAPGYRRRIVNAVADLSDKFKGTLLDLRHRPDVEIKRIRDLNQMLKEKEAVEFEQTQQRQAPSKGSVGGSVGRNDDDDDDDDDLVYAINAKVENTTSEGEVYNSYIGKMKVPPLNDENCANDDDDEEFNELSRVLQESIASARSSRQASSGQNSFPIPARVFPHIETGIPDSARVSSVHRKTRRFTYFMSLYQQLAGKDDHLDIFSMKKLLIDQQKRLLQLIYFYRDNRFDLPMIKRDYEHDLSLMVNVEDGRKGPLAKCNPVLALICVHLLQYSPKLQSLMSIYKQEGRATLSRVGFFTAAEECFHLLENKLFYEKQAEKGSILEQLIHVCRMRVSKTSILEERAIGHETAVFLRCEFHGETSFYATDLFCQQCDVDYAQLED